MKSTICPSDAHVFCARVFFCLFVEYFPEKDNLRDSIHKIRLEGLVFVLFGREEGGGISSNRKRELQ